MNRPGGKVAWVREKDIGPTPPTVLIVALYCTPTVPFGKVVVVIVKAGAIIMGLVEEMIAGGAAESVSVMIAENPARFAAVGVPLTTPVAGLIARPGGSPVADHIAGGVPPDVVQGSAAYGCPTTPLGRGVLEVSKNGALTVIV